MTHDKSINKQEMATYQDIPAEMPVVEYDHEQTNPMEINDYDKNKEAAGAEESFEISDLATQGQQGADMETSNRISADNVDE